MESNKKKLRVLQNVDRVMKIYRCAPFTHYLFLRGLLLWHRSSRARAKKKWKKENFCTYTQYCCLLTAIYHHIQTYMARVFHETARPAGVSAGHANLLLPLPLCPSLLAHFHGMREFCAYQRARMSSFQMARVTICSTRHRIRSYPTTVSKRENVCFESFEGGYDRLCTVKL